MGEKDLRPERTSFSATPTSRATARGGERVLGVVEAEDPELGRGNELVLLAVQANHEGALAKEERRRASRGPPPRRGGRCARRAPRSARRPRAAPGVVDGDHGEVALAQVGERPLLGGGVRLHRVVPLEVVRRDVEEHRHARGKEPGSPPAGSSRAPPRASRPRRATARPRWGACRCCPRTRPRSRPRAGGAWRARWWWSCRWCPLWRPSARGSRARRARARSRPRASRPRRRGRRQRPWGCRERPRRGRRIRSRPRCRTSR